VGVLFFYGVRFYKVIYYDFQEDLKKCIHDVLPKALLHRSIKLIVIDSITAVFRGEYTPSEMPRRSRDLRDVAVALHKLSVEHGLWVVCVNQVKKKKPIINITTDSINSRLGNVVNVKCQWKEISAISGIIVGQFSHYQTYDV